jgi:uncharacterized membrane protein YfcA
VLAVTLESAKTIAVAVVVIFIAGAFLAAWIMKTIVQKVATVLVLALLAFAVSSQRTSLQECADRVQDNIEKDRMTITVTETDCSFFGTTITVKDPRVDVDPA